MSGPLQFPIKCGLITNLSQTARTDNGTDARRHR
jgi:hypothetical protein